MRSGGRFLINHSFALGDDANFINWKAAQSVRVSKYCCSHESTALNVAIADGKDSAISLYAVAVLDAINVRLYDFIVHLFPLV